MALGNSPRSLTVVRLERAKSFAFEMRCVDTDGNAADITGATARLVVKQHSYDGGAEVINVAADTTRAAEGIGLFALQATQTDIDENEYPFDITMVSPVGYSLPVLKGVFAIGDNTDSDVSNTYSEASLVNGIEVVLLGSNILQVRLDGYVQNAASLQDVADAVAGLATQEYVDAADAALLSPDDIVQGQNITVVQQGGQVIISGQAGGGGGGDTAFAPDEQEPDPAAYAFWVVTP